MIIKSCIKIMILGAGITLLGCGFPVSSQDDVAKAKLSNKPTYTQLADIEHPIFSKQNKPTFSKLLNKEYKRRLVKKFPSVRSCLIKSEQEKDFPDLRLINWKKINDRDKLSICLEYVFISLEDIQAIEDWLLFHNAKNQGAQGPLDSTFGNASAHWWMWTRDTGTPFRDRKEITNFWTYSFLVAILIHEPSHEFYGVHSEWRTEGL